MRLVCEGLASLTQQVQSIHMTHKYVHAHTHARTHTHTHTCTHTHTHTHTKRERERDRVFRDKQKQTRKTVPITWRVSSFLVFFVCM